MIYFKKLKLTLTACGINSPTQVWPSDENGLQSVPKEKKVLAIKKVKAYQQVSAEQGEISTVLNICQWGGEGSTTDGNHKGERVQDNWVSKAPGDATTRDYITKAKFHEYGLGFAHYWRQQELTDPKC